MDADDTFASLVEKLAGLPEVQPPGGSAARRFGSEALKVNGSIFAMVTGGRVVMKLPRDRVEALIGDGTGAPFDSGKGRPMREWVTIVAGDRETTLALAHEALEFVRSGSRSR